MLAPVSDLDTVQPAPPKQSATGTLTSRLTPTASAISHETPAVSQPPQEQYARSFTADMGFCTRCMIQQHEQEGYCRPREFGQSHLALRIRWCLQQTTPPAHHAQHSSF
jgi:hypothetical protein